MLDKKYYAVVMLGGSVYGIGNSEEQAKNDSIKYIDSVTNSIQLEGILVDPEVAKDGEFFVCECSESFFDYVNFMGGDFSHRKDKDGLLVKE